MAFPDTPGPTIDSDSRAYWDLAAQGFRGLQRCSVCGSVQFYPRPSCTKCLGEVEWFTSSGNGRVYSFTIVHRAPVGFEHLTPYGVVLVDLEEGPRVMGRLLEEDLSVLQISTEVRTAFEAISDETALPQFRYADGKK